MHSATVLPCRDERSLFAGDVGLVNLGLSDDAYTYLSTDIDFIIHAAAYVNLVFPYAVSVLSVRRGSRP